MTNYEAVIENYLNRVPSRFIVSNIAKYQAQQCRPTNFAKHVTPNSLILKIPDVNDKVKVNLNHNCH